MKKEIFKKTINLSHEDFDIIVDALKLKREEIGQLCGVSAHAVSWWRSGQKIPHKHLVRLATELIFQLRDRPETRLDSQALKIFQQAQALDRAEGSALGLTSETYHNQKSPFDGIKFNSLNNEVVNSLVEIKGVSSKDNKNDTLLSLITLEELLREIGRRGFKVQIEPKE